MNSQLKEVIAYSDRYPMLQTVLCVGETLEQRDRYPHGTQRILEKDLREILEGITQQEAQKIAKTRVGVLYDDGQLF